MGSTAGGRSWNERTHVGEEVDVAVEQKPSAESAEPLGELDDDPRRAAEVAEPEDVLVLLQLAHQFSAAGLQTGNHGVDVIDGEREVADARRVRRRVPVVAGMGRRVELHQLEPAVAVRRLHHRDVRLYALEPNDAVHPATLDRGLALRLESEVGKELDRGCQVVDHHADVVHPLNGHGARWYETGSLRG